MKFLLLLGIIVGVPLFLRWRTRIPETLGTHLRPSHDRTRRILRASEDQDKTLGN